MRGLLALVVVLGVGGCTNADWAHVVSFNDSQWTAADGPKTDAPALDPSAAPARSGKLNPGCQTVASDRSSDVAMQGFDEDTQTSVYNRTYADCMAWAARGASTR